MSGIDLETLPEAIDIGPDLERRYTFGNNPRNDSTNAGQVDRREGESVAGFEIATQIDPRPLRHPNPIYKDGKAIHSAEQQRDLGSGIFSGSPIRESEISGAVPEHPDPVESAYQQQRHMAQEQHGLSMQTRYGRSAKGRSSGHSAAASFGIPDSLEQVLEPSTKPAKDHGGAFFGETPRYQYGDPQGNRKAKYSTGYAGKVRPQRMLGGGDPYNMPESKGMAPIGGFQAMGRENSAFGKEAVERASSGQFGGQSGARGRRAQGVSRLARSDAIGGGMPQPISEGGPFADLRHGRARKAPYPTQVLDEGTELMATPVVPAAFDVTVPRRQDLGVMSRDRQQGDRGIWDSLVSYDVDGNVLPMTGTSVARKPMNHGTAVGKQGLLEQSKLNPRRMFDDGVMGLGPTDAKFTGVWVDPYTGYEYDAYESEAAPPTGDYRVRESGKQRLFEMMHGGWAPGRARPKRRDLDPEEIAPDLPRENGEDAARQRWAEVAKIEELHSGHRDEYAWTDAEGYQKQIEGKPFNRWGLNEGNRGLPFPDINLHRDTQAMPQWGQGGAVVGTDAGYSRPGAMRSRVDNSTFENPRTFGMDGVTEGLGNIQDTNLQETLRVDALLREIGQTAIGLDGLPSSLGQWVPTEDPLTRLLSTREDVATALGQLFMRVTSDHVQTGEAALPDETGFEESLRDSEFVRNVGERLIQTGVTAPSMWPTHMQPTQREELAFALGQQIRALDGEVHVSGGPSTVHEQTLDNIEKDAMALAMGRAVLNMIGVADEGRGGGDAIRMATMEDSLRDSELVRKIGDQFQRTIQDGMMGGWQRTDDLTRHLRSSEFKRAIGETLLGLTTQAWNGSGPTMIRDSALEVPTREEHLDGRYWTNSRQVKGAGDPRAGFVQATDRDVWKRRDGVRDGEYQRTSVPDGALGDGDPTTVRDETLTRSTRGSKALDLTRRVWGSDFTDMQAGKRNVRLDSALTRPGGEVAL